MRAIVISRPGGPEVLEMRRVPDPEPRAEEVRVSVRATALNRADLLQRRGLYPAPPGVPAEIPGLEFAGEVERCGERVRGLEPGARVMGILAGGGYAEKVCMHERMCVPVPDHLAWGEAAAIPEAFLTAYDALFWQARLRADERVLVHAAGSGVGSAAVQLALAAGADVLGLSRTAAKRDRLHGMGLQHVFDPGTPGVVHAVRRATEESGVDVVLDLVGAPGWPLSLELLRERGRLVVIGLLGGAHVQLDLSVLMRKRLTISGSVLRSRKLEEKIELTRAFADRMGEGLAAGRLHAVVDRSFPLEWAADAHAVMEDNLNFGKIVLTVGGD